MSDSLEKTLFLVSAPPAMGGCGCGAVRCGAMRSPRVGLACTFTATQLEKKATPCIFCQIVVRSKVRGKTKRPKLMAVLESRSSRTPTIISIANRKKQHTKSRTATTHDEQRLSLTIDSKKRTEGTTTAVVTTVTTKARERPQHTHQEDGDRGGRHR